MTRAVGGVMAGILLLSGCSLYSPLPEPLSTAEVEALVHADRAAYWATLSGGEPFPEVEVIEILPPNETWPRSVECVAEMALPGVVISGDNVSLEEGGDQVALERAFFLCGEAYPVDYTDPSVFELYSDDELDYLWQYYDRYLVPCLRRNGYTITSPPDREFFAQPPYLTWLPYVELRPAPITDEDWERVDLLCARPPVGPEWRPVASP